MDGNITCKKEQVKANFIALEMGRDAWEFGEKYIYGVSIDSEIIIWNDDIAIAVKNYETVKNNILSGAYIRAGLEEG